MKIENSNINPLSTGKTDASYSIDKQSRQVDHVSSTQEKDKAELSSKAKILSKARIALNETPDVNTEKVNRLQESITSGTYQIPFSDLANRLLGKLGLR